MRWAIKMSPSEVKKLEVALNKVEDNVKKGCESSVNEVGNAMRSYARMIAPKDTKRLMRLIKYYKAKKGSFEGTLISGNPTASADSSYRGKEGTIANFNLAYWFAKSPKAKKHLKNTKSGYAKYMNMAAAYGDKIFAGIVERELNKKLK